VNLYRVFDWDGRSRGPSPGGPLYVPRLHQGAGRFDIPTVDGVLYASLSPVAAVAEAIQVYRNQSLSDDDFIFDDGRQQALAHFSLSEKARLVDLTDSRELAKRNLRPAEIATFDRTVTHRVAQSLHEEKCDGFLWWSALEASWTHVVLFQSRIQKKLKWVKPIQILRTTTPDVMAAAQFLKIRLEN